MEPEKALYARQVHALLSSVLVCCHVQLFALRLAALCSELAEVRHRRVAPSPPLFSDLFLTSVFGRCVQTPGLLSASL